MQAISEAVALPRLDRRWQRVKSWLKDMLLSIGVMIPVLELEGLYPSWEATQGAWSYPGGAPRNFVFYH
jgi:hypothetical protein